MDYYSILNISKKATETDIRKAYKKLALKFHPDKNMEKKELADLKMRQIIHAYEKIKKKKTR